MNQTRSATFSAYNKATAAARAGKLDEARTNRALGIALRTKPRPYTTTLTTCTCPDFSKRRQPCKHIIAKMIETRAAQLEKVNKMKNQLTLVAGVHRIAFAIADYYQNGDGEFKAKLRKPRPIALMDYCTDAPTFAETDFYPTREEAETAARELSVEIRNGSL